MILIFCDLCLFLAKKMAIFSNTNQCYEHFLCKITFYSGQKRRFFRKIFRRFFLNLNIGLLLHPRQIPTRDHCIVTESIFQCLQFTIFRSQVFFAKFCNFKIFANFDLFRRQAAALMSITDKMMGLQGMNTNIVPLYPGPSRVR
jgi:hypothetical protein